MKNRLTVLFAAVLSASLLFCSCGSGTSDGVKNADVAELYKAAQSTSADFEELVDVESSQLKFIFKIDEEWISDYSAAVSGNPAYAEEIAIFKASSSENTEKIKDALEKRIESRKQTLESYAPDEFKKLEKANVIIKGNYVYLIVCNDNKTAEKAVQKLL